MTIKNHAFRANVIRLRESRGWTQDQLAIQLNKTRGWLSHIESGRSKNITTEHIELFARVFGVSKTELLNEEVLEDELSKKLRDVVRKRSKSYASLDKGTIEEYRKEAKEKEKLREYYNLGEYAAFVKHQLMVDVWQESLLEKFGERNPLFSDKVSLLAYVTRLDQMVHRIAFGGDFLTFIERLDFELPYREREHLFKNVEWEQWTKYIETHLREISGFPERFLKDYFRYDIPYVYNERFEALAEMVGINEFMKLSQVEDPESLPNPVGQINGQYVWTKGQAFVLRGDYKEVKRFTHSFPLTLSKGYGMELISIGNVVDENEVFEIYSKERGIYSELLFSISHRTPWELLNVFTEYILKRVRYAPEVYHIIGHKHLVEGDLNQAYEYLKKANEIYESAIPEGFEGKIFESNHDEYHFGMLYLAIICFKTNRVDEGVRYIERVDEMTSTNHLTVTDYMDLINVNEIDKLLTLMEEEFIGEPSRMFENM